MGGQRLRFRQSAQHRAQFHPPLFQRSSMHGVGHIRQLFEREGGQLAFGKTGEDARR